MKLATRIEQVEATEAARQERVRRRVARQLSATERRVFLVFFDRWARDRETVVTEEERRVLCRVEALVRADPEAWSSDGPGVPRAWMEEHGYAAQ